MYESAKLIYPEVTDDDALSELLKSRVFTRSNANYQEKSSKFEDWFIELENPAVTEYMNTQKSMLLAVRVRYN